MEIISLVTHVVLISASDYSGMWKHDDYHKRDGTTHV